MLVLMKSLICLEEETEAQFPSAPNPERTYPLSRVGGLFIHSLTEAPAVPPQLLCGTRQAYLSSVESQT